MTYKRMLAALTLTALAVIGITVGGSALAAHGGSGEVVCKLTKVHGKRVVSCPRGALRGRRGPRGRQGKTGPTGPTGAAGGAGSNLNLNFNAYLTASKTKEITIGNFTITAAAQASGNCEPIRVRAGASDSQIAIGSSGVFGFLPNNTNKEVTTGKTTNMFSAVSENGSSTMSGIVGSAFAGGVCLVSGYVTGV
jgi:hypothetical protein